MEEGTLGQVQLAEWAAAPIVPVLKDDSSSVCFLMIFSWLFIYPIVKLDKYPLPKVEGLIEKLVRGKPFQS